MLHSLLRWLRTTFDYNPTFPLSALALLVGLRLLAGDGPDPHDLTVLESVVGLGILQGYELALLGTVLFVLWPRRIAYESTAILIIFSLVRFAAPFVVISLAADDHLGAALGFGAVLWALMAVKTRVVANALQLDLRGWERRLDVALYGLLTLGLPLLAHQLSAATGLGISYHTARILQLVGCWALAVGLAPLCLGLDGLGADGPLRSRRPAMVWRGLTGLGAVTLLLSAMWLAGDAPALLSLLPLALVGLALVVRMSTACGYEAPAWVVYAPAGAAALVVLLEPTTLMGARPLIPHALAALAFLVVAGLSLPLIDPSRARQGLKGLALVAAAAPLRFAPTAMIAEQYLLCAALAVAALGFTRQRDALLTHGAVAASLIALHLAWDLAPAEVLLNGALLAGSVLALLVAVRMPDLGAAGRVAAASIVGGASWLAVAQVPSARGIVAALIAATCLAVLARRTRLRPLGLAAGYAGSVVVLRKIGGGLDAGVALIALSFAAIPAGTWIAIQREGRLAQERDASFEDPTEPEEAPQLAVVGVAEGS